MPEFLQECKCLDPNDKNLMLKIIDETIREEKLEIKKIISKRERAALRPPFIESFVGIRSSLLKAHESFKKDVENLRDRVDKYPKCPPIIRPIEEIRINVAYPGYSETRKRLF